MQLLALTTQYIPHFITIHALPPQTIAATQKPPTRAWKQNGGEKRKRSGVMMGIHFIYMYTSKQASCGEQKKAGVRVWGVGMCGGNTKEVLFRSERWGGCDGFENFDVEVHVGGEKKTKQHDICYCVGGCAYFVSFRGSSCTWGSSTQKKRERMGWGGRKNVGGFFFGRGACLRVRCVCVCGCV